MLETEYRAHADTLDRYLAATFGTSLSPSEREEIRQQAFVGLVGERRKGTKVENDEALLVTCARNAAYSILRSADRRRRRPFNPQDSPEARLPDGGMPLDAAVIKADEDRRLKMLMDQLDERSRRVLQLRLEMELDAPEIADQLGVSISHAYKLLKRAGRALTDSIAANESGAHSAQQRALLAACEMGTATAQQRRQAEQLLHDPHARALLAEMRGLGHQAAALMPPAAVVTAPPSSGRVSHMLSSARQYAADLLGRSTPAQDAAGQIAASGGLRGSGHTAVAVMCGVGLLGGGTAVGVKECIDAGGPSALVDKLHGDSSEGPQPEETVEEIIVESPPEVIETTPIVVPDSSGSPDPVSRPDAPEPSSGPAPAPASGSAGSTAGLSGNPTPEPAPAPPPPPTTSSGAATSGGTGGSGTPGTAFGNGL